MHKAGGSFGGGNGDWICPSSTCANMNFARRSSCNRCGESRPYEAASINRGIEIGKSAADKSKGLFSADDWQCGKCGNVNWARRSTCNVCNAPRVSEVEERTGLGGGFNERAGVEYITRQDSDDEFDDFGRRKKKFRTGDAGRFKPVPEKRKEVALAETGGQNGRDVEEDGDEEEEEDEDPDDLSKYDLSGWGDEEETATAVPASQSTATPGSNDKQTDRRRARSSSGSSSSSSGSSSSSSSGSSRRRSRNGRSGRGRDGGRGRRSSSGSDSSLELRRRGSGTAASRSRSPSREKKRRRRHRRSSSSSSRSPSRR